MHTAKMIQVDTSAKQVARWGTDPVNVVSSFRDRHMRGHKPTVNGLHSNILHALLCLVHLSHRSQLFAESALRDELHLLLCVLDWEKLR